ncbi:ribosome hibernation promotion factor [Nocardioides panaciterrulae]|uniref:Ribosomal subunit interface protein n=1 Tax=Nocardioides panaciterrulae TaxID=661492 RepID=A0A7Y9E9K1_9ACTN|nr:HPF/RaiA family ribosome-associated protein [Nocardioides panaciterrulae]NYD43430.1 ribosomal subunit interface protein [Nocardioides panaciterrulae]
MTVPAGSAAIEVTARGEVDARMRAYAEEKVGVALAVARDPIMRAHVVLGLRHDPAVKVPATAEATVDVGGTVLRAQAAAPSMTEAIDELESRLRRRLTQLQDRTRTRHRWTGVEAEHEWRHGDVPRRPVAWYPRPAESRELMRRKTFAAEPLTVDEAAYDMESLDHDFFLYTDNESGEPALVRRLPEGGYAVQGGAGPEAVAKSAAEVVLEPPPPRLTDDEARARLDSDSEAFVFYLDAGSGQGRVLYRRYDGHYGLIVTG